MCVCVLVLRMWTAFWLAHALCVRLVILGALYVHVHMCAGVPPKEDGPFLGGGREYAATSIAAYSYKARCRESGQFPNGLGPSWEGVKVTGC